MSLRLTRRASALLLLLSAAALGGAPARAEVAEVSLVRQYGIHYLPLVVMEKHRLIEKEAEKAGLNLKEKWLQLSGGSSVNEALISGSVHIGAVGAGALIQLWNRTHGNMNVRGLAAVSDVPMLLLSRNPEFRTLKDISPKDRIALPAVKTSMQAITLQMAAAKMFGEREYQKFDQNTVSMAHPDAAAALLSGVLEVNAHFSAPPYTYRQLRDPKIHTVLNSFDVYGGPASLIFLYATQKFYDENPKVVATVLAALERAMEMINHDRRKAIQDYIEVTGEKMDADTIGQFVDDKSIRFRIEPSGVHEVAVFMHRVGSIKLLPKSWQDLFFPAIHARQGS